MMSVSIEMTDEVTTSSGGHTGQNLYTVHFFHLMGMSSNWLAQISFKKQSPFIFNIKPKHI